MAIDRRSLLKSICAIGLGSSSLVRCGDPIPLSLDSGGMDIGSGRDAAVPQGCLGTERNTGISPEDLRVGQVKRGTVCSNYLVGRDALGYYAMLAECPHERCGVEDPADERIRCNRDCGHGSVFDFQGRPLLWAPLARDGSCPSPLRRFSLDVRTENGRRFFVVDSLGPVTASFRCKDNGDCDDRDAGSVDAADVPCSPPQPLADAAMPQDAKPLRDASLDVNSINIDASNDVFRVMLDGAVDE